MTTNQKVSQISDLEISTSNMGDVILLWRMFNTHFEITLYKLQVMKVFYLAPNIMPSNIMTSGVIFRVVAT